MANSSKGSSVEADTNVLKKPRTVFTPKQLLHLEEEFVKNPFPNMEQRKLIAKDLELTQQHIQIWFQNRRAKNRRKKKRHSEEERMRRDPEPPSFWPSNLPFSSNIGDISKRNSSGETADGDDTRVVSRNDSKKSLHDNIKHTTKQQPTNQRDSHPPSYTLPTCTSTNDNNITTTATTTTRPSNLHCTTSKDAPLNSPGVSLTPGNGHHPPQIPTPPTPYNMSPVTSHPTLAASYAGSPIIGMMNHALTSPGGDLALQNYPPLPPPESLLSCNFDDPSSYSSSSVMCDTSGSSLQHSLHSLSTHARSICPLPIVSPPPYSFSSTTLTSCNIVLSSHIYSMDHHHHIHTHLPPPSTSTTPADFINPLTLSMTPSHSKPLLPVSTEMPAAIVGSGPSGSISPTISPITNSDCSLADASPLTQQDNMTLQATPSTLRNFSSTSSIASHPDNPNEATSLNTSISSLQRVSSPINATDLQEKDWELFSNSLCPVIQTHHDMWTVPADTATTQILSGDGVTRSKAVANTTITTTGSSSSSQQYSNVYGVEFSPSYNSEVSNSQPFTMNSVTNGAKQ